MRWAEQETLLADLFIVLGSSLVVYPAAGFPELAKHNGAKLVIVNREETGLDRHADLVLHEPRSPSASRCRSWRCSGPRRKRSPPTCSSCSGPRSWSTRRRAR